jgi:hypothetical protein
MPKLGDIDKLKEIVDSLGDEKEIRRQRGERIEEVAPPEQELSASDLDDLLGVGGGAAEGPAETEAVSTEAVSTEAVIAEALKARDAAGVDGIEDAQIDDISKALEETGEAEPASEETMGLDVLPETFGEDRGPAAEGEASGAEIDTSAIEGFELPDFGGAEGKAFEQAGSLPAEGETPSGELAVEPAPVEPAPVEPAPVEPAEELAEETAPPAPPEPAGEISPEPTFDLSDFQIPETPSVAAGTGADQLFEPAPETPAGSLPEEPSTGPGATEAEAMEGLTEAPPEESGQFNLPDFGGLGGTGGEAEGEAPPPEGEAGASAEEADLSGLEEKLFDLPESEGAPGPEREAGETPAEEPGAFAGFEMPDLSEIEGAPGETPAPGASAAAEAPAERGGEEGGESLDQIEAGEFALPEFGKDYTPQAREKREYREPAAAPGTEELGAPEELAGAEEEAQYSQRDFDNIKATLAILPLNLKIMVEELIGDSGLRGPKLKRLLDALIAGESPRTVAAIVSSITGQKIVLPKSFEKRSGVAFEREKDSFAYFLRTKGAWVAFIFIIGIAVLGVLAWGAYNNIFRPLAAIPVYDEGYQAIQEDKYETAKEKFDEASSIWDSKDQYYRYADAYIASAAGNYRYADDLYQRLLARYPGDIKGMIDYARLETLQENYPHAESLLVDGVLKHDMYNFDALAACADNYLAWAADKDYSKIKDADYYYSTLAEHYRDRTAAHLKRIEFLIAAERLARSRGDSSFDNTNLVAGYIAFLRRKGWDVVDPAVYTDMAEYLIDKDRTGEVAELLDKARAADPGYAPAWYETARYDRLVGETERERNALERAIDLFRKPASSAGRGYELAAERRSALERSARLVLALNSLGEYYIAEKQPERAESLLEEARGLYEQSAARLKTTRFAAGGQFGRLYYNLGNVALGAGNDDRALELYAAAEENGFSSPDQTYKKGFVYYRKADYADALMEFNKVGEDLPDNPNVLFALATTEYRRLRYRIAEGYYLYLVGVLGREKDALPEINVETNPAHRALITDLYITYNNLGCAYFKLANNAIGPELTAAENYLRQAADLYDVMSRDPDTLARLEETTIAARVGKKEIVKGKGAAARYLKAPAPFYNLDVVFHGKADSVVLGEKIDVLVYDLVPRDVESPELLSTHLTSQ